MSAKTGLIKVRDADRFGVDYGETLIEIGSATFSTTDSQATYRTQLTEVTAGFVNITDTWSPATDAAVMNDVAVPLGAVSSGSIVLTRSSKANSGAVVSVLLVGRVFDTA